MTGKSAKGLLSTLLLLPIVWTTGALAYDPGYPFNQYPSGGYKEYGCSEDLPGSLFTTGPIEYSCRETGIAHINGQPNKKFKFTAIACGRSDTDRVAKHNAGARAHEAIFKLWI